MESEHYPTFPQGRARPPTSSPAFVQVCDRCRWKKIKCDGQRPCQNCRNAHFPCEAKARLAKHATPRSYVQYLEARVRQLEGQHQQQANKPSPANLVKDSPYSKHTVHSSSSPSSSGGTGMRPSHPVSDMTQLKELGTHVMDEDGFTRYMGPSSGVGFAAQVLQDLMTPEQQDDPTTYTLFTLDDFNRSHTLEQMDNLLWTVVPTDLPDRGEADRVLGYFFCFTQRHFPVLHRPTFMDAIDRLYRVEHIDVDSFELLAQFYFAMSVGHFYDMDLTKDERTQKQVRAIETGIKCHFTTFHTRRDGLTRLQTLVIHSYALALLRQRSVALRISAMANTKALECGLHHDGNQFSGNPLEQQMRRRVFWSCFMLHLYLTTLAGLPRLLHEADITIAEPDDIDDEQLTTTEVLNKMPGRTKIHRFVSMCRLVRILSRCLDVLYSTNKRKHASTKIEHMNRLCCDHLLDQLDFNFNEVPDDIPDIDVQDPEEIATLASYVNEQLLYHYIRWLIHRPGLALDRSEPLFGTCLQAATEAGNSLLEVAYTYRRVLPLIKANPASHPMTIFVAALTSLHRAHLNQIQPTLHHGISSTSEEDHKAALYAWHGLNMSMWDKADERRVETLRDLILKVFGNGPEALRMPSESQSSQTSWPIGPPAPPTLPELGEGFYDTAHPQAGPSSQAHLMDYQQHRLDHLTAHEDLRNFVHEAFSPGIGDLWGDPPQGGHMPGGM